MDLRTQLGDHSNNGIVDTIHRLSGMATQMQAIINIHGK